MPFAFIPGLGMQEIILLGGMCFMMVVVPIGITLYVIRMNRKNSTHHGGERMRDLEDENRRLRDDLERRDRDQ